ncbi:hypothetical protein CVT24_004713 [Panaeolus cyanescens]|uniref:G domain-containing protein n=1 Tax=Panaeolus cyanescens TaxID=181874 RepID=A0A409YSN9_9AGAR|nr:hypothetical protein CVT24_004713 [Panaeolus cyanescens]
MQGAMYQPNTKLHKIHSTGTITARPCNEPIDDDAFIFLALGPTGSGKSSFIEALAGPNTSLGISKNQLAGYTQDCTAYILVNAWYQHRPRKDNTDVNNDLQQTTMGKKRPIIIVDSPGFADSKLSMQGIMTKIRTWMMHNGNPMTGSTQREFHHVLCFTPITDTRLSGSKHKVLEVCKKLTRVSEPHPQPQAHASTSTSRRTRPRPRSRAGGLTLVTTMWDMAGHNDRVQQRAESNFKQMHDIWEDAIQHGTTIVKFLNAQPSALKVLDTCLESYQGGTVLGQNELWGGQPYSTDLVRDLEERVIGLGQVIEMQRDELGITSLITSTGVAVDHHHHHHHNEFAAITENAMKDAERDLERFAGEIVGMGPGSAEALRGKGGVSEYAREVLGKKMAEKGRRDYRLPAPVPLGIRTAEHRARRVLGTKGDVQMERGIAKIDSESVHGDDGDRDGDGLGLVGRVDDARLGGYEARFAQYEARLAEYEANARLYEERLTKLESLSSSKGSRGDSGAGLVTTLWRKIVNKRPGKSINTSKAA